MDAKRLARFAKRLLAGRRTGNSGSLSYSFVASLRAGLLSKRQKTTRATPKRDLNYSSPNETGEGIQTPDPLITNQTLYQPGYAGQPLVLSIDVRKYGMNGAIAQLRVLRVQPLGCGERHRAGEYSRQCN
jgi:hypothetical protein